MTAVIAFQGHEIEASFVMEQGAFRATVMVRPNKAVGQVRAVGYIFEERFATHVEAMHSAQRLALSASMHPDRHLAGADGKFANA